MFNLQDYNAKAKDYLGVTVFWTVHRCHTSVDNVKNALLKAGLNPDLADDVGEKKAFGRAGKAVSKTSAHAFARKITDNQNQNILGIVSEKVDVSNEQLDYTQTTTAKLDKETKEVQVEGAHKEDFVNSYEHYRRNLTDMDIRNIILEIIRGVSGVSLRQTGGIYFVPRNQIEEICKIDSWLRVLNAGQVYIMRVVNSEEEKQIAFDSAKSEVQERVNSIVEAVSKMNKRIGNAEKQAKSLEETKKMLEFYTELCNAETFAAEIQETVQEAQKKVAEKIRELELQKEEETKLEETEKAKVAEEKAKVKKVAQEEKTRIKEEKKLFRMVEKAKWVKVAK